MQNPMYYPYTYQQNILIKQTFRLNNIVLTVSALNNCLEIFNPLNYKQISYSDINYYDIERIPGGGWKLVIYCDQIYEFYSQLLQTWQNWFQILQMFLKRKIDSFLKEYQYLDTISNDGVISKYKFKHKLYNQLVFVKAFKKNRINQDHYRLRWINNQMRILKALSGQYTPKIYEFYDHQQYFIVIQQFIQGQTLGSYIQSNDCSVINNRKKVMINLLKALKELKKHRIVHRNINPNNVMITKTGFLKIINFNYATVIRVKDQYVNWLKHGYIAPQLDEFHINYDIYNIGIILYQMIFKIPYFQRQQQYQHIPKTSSGELSLIKKMVQENPYNRITLQQAFSHRYFKEQNN